MSSLLNTLKNLKDKLVGSGKSDGVFNDNVSDNKEEKKAADNKAILAEALKQFKHSQVSKVNINAGGKIYSTSRATITNCSLKTVFLQEIENNNEENKEIFYDGNPELFKYVLDTIRFFNVVENKDNTFVITINLIQDEVVLREMLSGVFLASETEQEIFKKVKIEREAVKVKATITAPIPTTTTAPNYNYNNNNRNAAYNYGY